MSYKPEANPPSTTPSIRPNGSSRGATQAATSNGQETQDRYGRDTAPW